MVLDEPGSSQAPRCCASSAAEGIHGRCRINRRRNSKENLGPDVGAHTESNVHSAGGERGQSRHLAAC